MHAHYKIGFVFLFLICTRAFTASENQTEERKYFDEEDYEDDYYDADEDDGVIRSLPDDEDNTRPTSTTAKTIEVTKGPAKEMPKLEPKCPENCDCSNENKFINCSNRNLNEIPKNFPVNVLRLDLSNNLIGNIPEDAFKHLKNLRELFLNGNQISELSPEIFLNLRNLTQIDLGKNTLKELHPDTFNSAVVLSKLNLSHNPITISSGGSILRQGSLKELSLVNCTITKLQDEAFSEVVSLTSLSLTQNNMNKKINTKAFEPLKNLGKLNLPDIEENTVKELCNLLPSIDVISLEHLEVSCFELVSGTSFQDSIITNTGGSPLSFGGYSFNDNQDKSNAPKDETTKVSGGRITHSDSHPRRSELGTQTNRMDAPSNLPASADFAASPNDTGKIGQGDEDMGSPATSDDDEKTYQVAVSSQTINQILIGIIVVAVIGLVIGIVFRKDLCGIKTKLCRTRRPPTTDQVRPAEEVPLNKV